MAVDPQQRSNLRGRGRGSGGVTGKGFMPGISGNPSGRPPNALSLAKAVRRIGDELIAGAEGRSMSRIEALIRRCYIDGIAGDTAAAELIFDRGWGRPLQPVLQGDWRREAEEQGVPASEVFEKIVEAFMEGGEQAALAASPSTKRKRKRAKR